MIDFRKLEEKLNSDPHLRQSFLNDPAGILEREWLVLTEKNKQALAGVARRLGAQAGGAGPVNLRKIVVNVLFEYGA
jgi:hypothetical protein